MFLFGGRDATTTCAATCAAAHAHRSATGRAATDAKMALFKIAPNGYFFVVF